MGGRRERMRKYALTIVVLLVLVGVVGVVLVSAYYDSAGQRIVIPINKGWNLIPLFSWELDDNSPIKMNDIQHGYFYSRDLKKYVLLFEGKWNYNMKEEVFKNEDPGYSAVSTIWAYSDKEGDMMLTWGDYQREHLSISNSNLPLNLKSGWNFIFITPEMEDKTLEDIKGNCDILNSYVWWDEGQKWDKFPFDGSFPKVLVGKGVVIRVREDCTLGGDGINPPNLPPSVPQTSDVSSQNSCRDTDGGENYYVKGIITVSEGGITSSGEDECGKSFDNSPSDNPNQLNEKYCRSDGNALEKLFICPNGCNNGACIR